MAWKYFKLVYVAVLFSAFLCFFGIPNVRQYLADDNLVVDFTEISAGKPNPAPAITICSLNPSTRHGWKPNVTSVWDACAEAAAQQQLEACVVENTFSLEESILSFVKPGMVIEAVNSSGEHFYSEMPLTVAGQCHSLASQIELYTVAEWYKFGTLSINMNNSLAYYIAIYDKNFFYMSLNAKAFPGFWLKLEGYKQRDVLYMLDVVKHQRRSTANTPCNEDQDFNFSNCVKEKVEACVGCSLPWQKYGKFDTCRTVDQFKKYQELNFQVNYMNPQEVSKKFGCQFPCQYNEFKLVEEVPRTLAKKTLNLTFSLINNEFLVKKEIEMYGLTSLVGDIGGSLGLFLGFSLVMVWDAILHVAMMFKEKIFIRNKDVRIQNHRRKIVSL